MASQCTVQAIVHGLGALSKDQMTAVQVKIKQDRFEHAATVRIKGRVSIPTRKPNAASDTRVGALGSEIGATSQASYDSDLVKRQAITRNGFTIGPVFDYSKANMGVSIVLFKDVLFPANGILLYNDGSDTKQVTIDPSLVYMLYYGKYDGAGKPRVCSILNDDDGANNCSWSCLYSYTMTRDAKSGQVHLTRVNDPHPQASLVSTKAHACAPIGDEDSVMSMYHGLEAPISKANTVMTSIANYFDANKIWNLTQVAHFEPARLPSWQQQSRLELVSKRFRPSLTMLGLNGCDTDRIIERVVHLTATGQ